MFHRKERGSENADGLWLIVGLGNPGAKYEYTRHNAGFMTVDFLARRHGIEVERERHKSLTGKGSIAGAKVMLAKPLTYMNLSGESVSRLLGFFKIPDERLIVIYDDIDIALGTVRVRPSGSAGTHNGMRNVIKELGSERFARIRIGIGADMGRKPLYDFVTSDFTSAEKTIADEAIARAADAAETIITSGVEAAMQRHNGQ